MSQKLKFEYSLNIISVAFEYNRKRMLSEFSSHFDGSFGKFSYIPKINLKWCDGTNLIFFKHVPFAYKEKLEAELERLESLKVITRIWMEHSKWGTSLVTVL